jgi:DNA invertase Pin-like site-specific DNA recombinase
MQGSRARQSGTKSGKPIGRPRISAAKERTIRAQLEKGTGILKTAKKLGVGTGTVQRIAKADTAQVKSAFAGS